MKNFIIALLVLVIPVSAYLYLNRNSSDYTAMALDSNNPSLLIFTSAMCMDCKRIKEVIKDIEGSYSDKINFVKMNALDNDRKIQESIRKYDVTVVPTLVFTDAAGVQTDKTEGFISKEELIKKIEEAVNE